MHRNPSPAVRRAVTRTAVGTTAMAAVLAVIAGTAAFAAPASPGREARAVGIGTTETQRVDAAAVVRLDPTWEVLLLSDHDFVHALWQKARDGGEAYESVRTAAEKAMASTLDADHVAFITTGVHEAHRLDQQRERDKAEAARLARLARRQVMTVIGITGAPDLLELNDENFIRAVLRHPASGPEVRAAATAALTGTPAARQEFIANGAREAHNRDVARELLELAEKDRKEAELRKNQAARKNIAALFRIPMTQSLLDVSDEIFIREMLRAAPADLRNSELYRAAQSAVNSMNPGHWQGFLHSGAEAAYKRDDAARRAKLAEADRVLVRQILTAAQESGFNPNLVASAEKALAAGDMAVAEFLSEQGQKRARRQTLVFGWATAPATWHPIRHTGANGGAASVGPVTAASPLDWREKATWLVLPALSGEAGCYSFEAAAKPGHYLKADESKGLVTLAADNNTAAFRSDATWCAKMKGWPQSRPTAAWFIAGSYNEGTQVAMNQRNELSLHGRWSDDIDLRAHPAWQVVPPLAP
ncbi:AbfB domain-containing protein [Streptomyces sp. NPDC006553]|uniref:AbfB domain-containing protein n=1 Tax=Streptomyces sp. NPDC006553 TaxID=3157180 RepID=UPI0033BACF40